MKTTARFEVQRRNALKSLFEKKKLVDLWRQLVKDQLRDLEILDLHDYYDFNYAIESRVDSIIARVLAGQYRAESPLIYRSEKKFGVCRHMLIPSPSDAVVFQTLTDAVYNDVIKAQPWKGAYFSRDRHRLKMPHEAKEAKSYPWFVLWPRFQKQIWDFSKAHKYLVTTDLSNYFDNISLRELRHVISSISKVDEVYLDLLFSLVEDLSWNPDYLPSSHKGLPTINIEAPRLLAHALLFEVDDVLKNRTSKSFVRWMDDINFGVDDRLKANRILGEVNDVLKSRGLALNLSKTAIYTAREVRSHFLFEANRRLDALMVRARKLKSDQAKRRLSTRVARSLSEHLKHSTARNKDKVTKRHLTVLGVLRQVVAVEEASRLFKENPGIRQNVLNYLSSLPFRKKTATAFLSILKPKNSLDDITLLLIVDALIRWNVPKNKKGKIFAAKVTARLSSAADPFEWLAQLRFATKYGSGNEVIAIVNKAATVKAADPFFRRQRMAALPRALAAHPKTVQKLWAEELKFGATDSASVAANVSGFSNATFPSKGHRSYFYLFPHSVQKPYPLPKFLLLCCIAHSEASAGVKVKRPEVIAHVTDPWYRDWLKGIQPAWF